MGNSFHDLYVASVWQTKLTEGEVMNDTGHTWALILAAGEGSRLRSLTTTRAGIAVPKQFCSLCGGLSLLHETLQRAAAIADPQHICTIVAEQHRRWWESALSSLPRSNVIVQPENRGTGNGILLPLLHIMNRDPNARIVLLPSDHHVRDEGVLARALKLAVAQLAVRKQEILMLGLEPDEVDPELGYIVPGDEDGYGARSVARFVEKPSAALARGLLREGALWNAFIVVAKAQALLDLFSDRFPDVVASMLAVVAHDSSNPMEPVAARHLYGRLPEIDFSRHVLQGFESPLRVLAVPPCGWSDLGTPERVARTLRCVAVEKADFANLSFPLSGHLNLAAQHSGATV